MAAATLISLRDRLTGSVVDLLDAEGMACLQTQEGLVITINALSLYREEGRKLFPELFVVDDLNVVLSALPSSEFLPIGSGPREAATMARALKQCAPLAQGGWAIYVHRQNAKFNYGLFRCGVHILSVPISDLLVNKGDPQIPTLMVRPLAENVVELKGVGGSAIIAYFGATKATNVSPVDAINALVTAIVANVDEKIREQTFAFFERTIANVLRASHGTLAVVQPARRRTFPPTLRDGILLQQPMRVVSDISDLISRSECSVNTRLQNARELITGMLLSDGITVFGSDGSVRGYNIFVRHKQGATNSRSGGARRRTFETLCLLLEKDLDCVLMQSQDGAVDYRRG
jgi:hypothetical protein